MKAAIVLLADYAIQNDARRIVFDLNTNYRVPFNASLLPAHVSLLPPFEFQDMTELENYFDSLAEQTAPLDVILDRFYFAEYSGHAMLGWSVSESAELRELHNTIRQEMHWLYKDTGSLYGSKAYRFHMTLEMGPLPEAEGLKAYYDHLPHPIFYQRFTARDLALLFYAEGASSANQSILYRVRPLEGIPARMNE